MRKWWKEPTRPVRPAVLDKPDPAVSKAMLASIQYAWETDLRDYQLAMEIWAQVETQRRASEQRNTFKGGEALRRRHR